MKKSSLIITISLIIFKIILEYNYITFVHPLFSYFGMTLDISFLKLFESYATFLFLIWLLIYIEKFNYTSKILVIILFSVLYTPLISIYWLQDNSRIFFYLVSLSFVMLILALAITPKLKIKALKEGRTIFILIVAFTTLVVYGSLISSGGLSRLNFNLSDVYEFRAMNIYSSNVLLAYLVPWQGLVVNLSVIGISLFKKNYKISAVFLFLQFLLFAMTNHKSYLFAPIILLVVYFISMKSKRESYLLWFSTGTTLLVLVTTIVYKLSDSLMLPSIFIRRLFFIPAHLHFVYHEFFQDKEKFLLSHSVLNGITDTNYDTTPVGLVSAIVYDQPGGANVGFFADAYVNFGAIGIFIFTILLFIVLKLIDSITDNIPGYISVSILLIPFMSLINSAFFTSLLTHGILFSILMIWLSKGFFTSNIKR